METTITLLIATDIPGLLITASGVMGLAVAVFIYWLYQVLHTEDLPQDREWRYDVTRINELRRIDIFYRVFKPLIQLLAAFNRAAFREALPEIHREIQAAGLPRFWLAEEYLARAELFALALSPLYG